MRQRVKLAQAIAHEPELLLLDEPLNGLDPTQREHVIALLIRLGEQGRTVIVSSHVLHEVERMAPRVLVLVNGHLVAEGSTAGIRQLISERPRRVLVTADNARALARELMSSAGGRRRADHRRRDRGRDQRAVDAQPRAAGRGRSHAVAAAR